MMPTLDQLRPGQRCRIDKLDGAPDLVQRLLEFGLMEGETVDAISIAPLGDPLEIQIGGTRLSIRKREAASINVTFL
jgi:ferrous iron transport protein A